MKIFHLNLVTWATWATLPQSLLEAGHSGDSAISLKPSSEIWLKAASQQAQALTETIRATHQDLTLMIPVPEEENTKGNHLIPLLKTLISKKPFT